MKNIIICISLILFASTARSTCVNHLKALDKSAEAIAYVLNCRNLKRVRLDVETFAEKVHLCQRADVIPPQVCSIIGKVAANSIKKRIPLVWLCKPDIAMKVVEMAISQTCKRILIGGFNVNSNYYIH